MANVKVDRTTLNNFRNAFCMTYCSHHANIIHRECRECRMRHMTLDNYGRFRLKDLLEVRHDG